MSKLIDFLSRKDLKTTVYKNQKCVSLDSVFGNCQVSEKEKEILVSSSNTFNSGRMSWEIVVIEKTLELLSKEPKEPAKAKEPKEPAKAKEPKASAKAKEPKEPAKAKEPKKEIPKIFEKDKK